MWRPMITMAPWVMTSNTSTDSQEDYCFRKPNKEDGLRVHELIESCPPLDTNSSYCNFLQTAHFRDTCVVVERDGKVVAFTSGYIRPDSPDTLFVWQVAVSATERGQGLGLQMLNELLTRKNTQQVRFLETTITDDNKGSWALFDKLNTQSCLRGEVTTFLDKHKHFSNAHDSEYLYRIQLRK